MPEQFLRAGFTGPPNSGKTIAALQTAHLMAPNPERILVLDTEGGAMQYRNKEVAGMQLGNFQVVRMYAPYTAKRHEEIVEQNQGNFDILVVDSLSHEWRGKGGATFQKKAKEGQAGGRGDGRAQWNQILTDHNSMMDTLANNRFHLIATVQSKGEAEYASGGVVPNKVPDIEQRTGTMYYFDLFVYIDRLRQHFLMKSRVPDITGEKDKYTKSIGKAALLYAISGARDTEALRALHGAHSQLQDKAWFTEALTQRKKELK
jgi:hypothetical protein